MAFSRLWSCDQARNNLLEMLECTDLCSLRLSDREVARKTAESLFRNIRAQFSASCFTRQARIASLQRIGQHVESFEFIMPHEEKTFLPPLLDPYEGSELDFSYQPLASLSDPARFGSPELGELLVRQYDPIFHSACDVPSFIAVFRSLPNLKTLRVATSGQSPTMRYRTSAVDYALISLRIAIERSHLPALQQLVLSPVHPASVQYLRPGPFAFGSSPSGQRRWRQIKRLKIEMEAWDFEVQGTGTDHLKLLREFITAFAPRLADFDFRWIGRPGPFPLVLEKEPLLKRPLTPLSAPKILQDEASRSIPVERAATASLGQLVKYRPVDPPPNTPQSARAIPPLSKLITNLTPMASLSDLLQTNVKSPPHSAPAYLPSQYCPPLPKKLRMPSLQRMKMRMCLTDASQIHTFIRRHARSLRYFEFNQTDLRSGDWKRAFRYLDRISNNKEQGPKESSVRESKRKGSVRRASHAPELSQTQAERPERISSLPCATSNARTSTPAIPAVVAWTPITQMTHEIQSAFGSGTADEEMLGTVTQDIFLPQGDPIELEASAPSPKRGIRAGLMQKLQALSSRAEARRQQQRQQHAVYGAFGEEIEEVVIADSDILPPTPSLTAASSAASSLRSLSIRSADSISVHSTSKRPGRLQKRPRINKIFSPEASVETLATSVDVLDSLPDLTMTESIGECSQFSQDLCDRKPRILIPPGLRPPSERHPSQRPEHVDVTNTSMSETTPRNHDSFFQDIPIALSSAGKRDSWETDFVFDLESMCSNRPSIGFGYDNHSSGCIPIMLQRFSKQGSDQMLEARTRASRFPGGYI